jgi:hypothetical protein
VHIQTVGCSNVCCVLARSNVLIHVCNCSFWACKSHVPSCSV